MVGQKHKECSELTDSKLQVHFRACLPRNVSKHWSTVCHYFDRSQLSWLDFGQCFISQTLTVLPFWVN